MSAAPALQPEIAATERDREDPVPRHPPALWPVGPGRGRGVVRVDNLTKRFPVRRSWTELLRQPLRRERATALDGVTFDVHEGEFYGLLGANGAGKTTLFKILATLILPDGGRASVAGRDVVKEAAAAREALVPAVSDERSLFWRLTAAENLRLFARLQGLSTAESVRRGRELLELVGLEETGEKLVGAFSSGMKQRLLIARALLARPRVLLLDEPTRSLDPLSARDFRRFLRERVAGEQGCAVLLATHVAEEALDLCDRVAILDRGRLLAEGPADELARRYDRPSYRLLARASGGDGSLDLVLGVLGARRRRLRTLEDGWVEARLELPEGEDAAAAFLAGLTARVDVARFAREESSLADLLERVITNGAGPNAGQDAGPNLGPNAGQPETAGPAHA